MDLIKELKKIDVIQHGKFKLKSGEIADIYIDLRKVISYPNIHKKMCEELYRKINMNLIPWGQRVNLRICGTPYGAIPYTSYISISNNISMIFLRKEQKNHGTQKLIEGVFKKGDRVILIEDVITTGDSVKCAASTLEKEGLIVLQIISVFSRCMNKELYYKNLPIEYLYHIDDYNI